MRRLCLLLVALVPTVAWADRSLTASASIDCAKDPEVSINASAATFTFTGTCEKISVNGSSNTITIENVKKVALNGTKNTVDLVAADKIGMNGSENTVRYQKGLSGAKPTVGGVGTKNTATQK